MPAIPDPWALLVLGSLAVWRVTGLLHHEVGPFAMLSRLRGLFGVLHDRDGEPYSWPAGSPFACWYCLSVWVALGMFGLWFCAQPVVVLFAIAGAAALMQRHIERGG